MKKLVVAIDGPAGAGKSTVAKLSAKRLGYTYIDTGAMYRTVALRVTETGRDVTDELILEIAKNVDISLNEKDGVLCVTESGEDVTGRIRTPNVTRIVSHVAKLAPVREKLVAMQRKMAESGGIIMDGRDIASHVLPDADVKIFLTADLDERARRRFEETNGGSLEEIKKDIASRDKEDSERKISPLIRVPEATLLDSTNLTIDEVVEKICDICGEK